MTHRPRTLVALAVLAAALGTGLSTGACFLFEDNGADGALTLYGNVEVREAVLGFRVSGRVTEMAFEEGETVGAGALLARLDAEPYEESLRTAELRVDQARARLAKLEKGSRPQEIEQAAARVDQAEAAFVNARKTYERKLGLLDSGASSQREVDAALAARDEAGARLSAARESLDLAREGFRREDVEAARADLAVARAQVDEARTRLEDTDLYAPSDGVVLTRVQEPGTVVGQGAPVYTLSLPDPVYVRAYVAEPDLGRVVPGTAAWVSTDSSTERYQGTIGFVSPRAEFTPRAVETPELRTDLVYRLRVIVPGPADALRLGMPVTVEIPLDQPPDGAAADATGPEGS
jgi:HlyD family secretion protein